MPDIKDFKEFYNSKLKQQLEKIEEERLEQYGILQQYKKKYGYIGAIIGVFAGIGLSFIAKNPTILSTLFFMLLFALFVGAFGLAIGYSKRYKHLQKIYTPFKEKVITPLIKHFHPSFEYLATGRIPDEDIAKSQLFQTKIDMVHGDDLVEGKIDDTKFRFSELTLAKEMQKSDMHGNPSLVNVSFFKGIFLAAELPFNFKGQTFILPDWKNQEQEDKLFTKMDRKNKEHDSKKIKKWFPEAVSGVDNLQELEIGDEEFDHHFRLFSTNPDEIKDIMNNGLLNQLKLLRELGKDQLLIPHPNQMRSKYNERAVYLALHGNTFYLGKPFDRLFFNPDLTLPLINSLVTKQCFNDIRLMVNMIKEVRKSVDAARHHQH